MEKHRRYIARENVERFEALLRSNRLDWGQADVVRALLAEARAELAALENAGRREGLPRATPSWPAGLDVIAR